jgi:hypothetical protein
LNNWIYRPPADKIVLSLVTHLQNVEDAEAKFLLENISCWLKQMRSADMLKEMAWILGNLDRKHEFKVKAIIMTDDEWSFTPDTQCVHQG